MVQSETRSRFGWGALTLGLVVGLVAGALGAAVVLHKETPKTAWVETGVTWFRLPSHAATTAAPQTFALPAAAWDYGAISAPLGSLAQARPSILEVKLTVASGRAGVSLATPDGQKLISPERSVAAGAGETAVHFAVGPDQGPAAVLLRNYDAAGQAGSVTVSAVRYAREDDLTPDEVARINKGQ